MLKKTPLKIYGVLGYPAKHSLSPLMHNAALRNLKINARYEIFEKKPQELKRFLDTLRKNNIFGINVTVPYKEKVIPYLNKISAQARLIAAVNTIRVSKSGLEGFNTDADGFLRHLTEELKFNPEGKNISLIGAGGAAKAVSVALSKQRPSSMAVFDVDRRKASCLIKHLKNNYPRIEFRLAGSINDLGIDKADLLLNATPIGMKNTDSCLVDKRLLHKKILVYDLIYNPKKTKLLLVAERKGAKISNGLGMLLYQGARSFEIWTGRKAPIGIMRKALKKGA